MKKGFESKTTQDFASLSLRDLLAARDQYHFHLMNKENVIGTAVGRYLIRNEERWPEKRGEHVPRAQGPRTFDNSEVRDYSWPCVLVLVKHWVTDFGTGQAELHPHEMVPSTLYMPDGRMVPVCVVQARPSEQMPQIPDWQWPSAQVGPGYPLLVDHQGLQRVASIGCLVSDGHTTYALTNRHVCGPPGEIIYTSWRGRHVRIGVSSDKQITRMPFSEVYPDYPGRRTFLNLDVGLVEIDDLRDWTSRVFDLGKIGELADLHEANLGLNLIEAHVVAHGAASGELEGQIKGLFYRYKSVGGYDYVADYLIAPRGNVSTQRGDSGTVWHLVRDTRGGTELLPLAVEWGAQALNADTNGQVFNYALATGLSSICRTLDVEIVHEEDLGPSPTWGQLGHYGIGTFAIGAVENPKLKTLMTANVDRISFAGGNLDPKVIKKAIKDAKANKTFIPLADVPDLVWKNVPTKIAGGRDRQAGIRTTGPEHPTHYADIDEPHPNTKKTLRELCMADGGYVDVDKWRVFYTDCGHTKFSDRGCLPFRIWQFFDLMVESLNNKDVDAFVCAAGLLSHYVGDACQPLHGSMFADGYKDQPKTVTHTRRDGSGTYETESNVGAGVHTAYETAMIDRKRNDIVAKLPGFAKKYRAGKPVILDGKTAAIETVKLMNHVATVIPPEEIVDEFIALGETKTVAVYDGLWTALGDRTIEVMGAGADLLAMLWDGAWTLGKGDDLNDVAARSFDALQALYEDPTFAPSLDLDAIKPVLKGV